MKQSQALHTLMRQAEQGQAVFDIHDFGVLFPDDSPRGREAGITRLVKAGWLERVARGLYVFPTGLPRDGFTLERLARSLRLGEDSYVSLESALSEWGAISQVPLGYLTVMTTGRKGVFRTRYGTIEFTHTQRSARDLVENTISNTTRPLRIATPEAAWRDLKRVGRNTHLVDTEELTEIIKERSA